MDIKGIQKLIDLVKKNNVAELEISQNGEMVHIVLNSTDNTVKKGEPTGLSVNNSDVKNNTLTEENHELKVPSNRKTIKSPMVGTVYLASSPNELPFVHKGKKVKVGDTLCIIEAMKMFNRIEADQEGVIVDILVQDSSPVEYGQILFVIE